MLTVLLCHLHDAAKQEVKLKNEPNLDCVLIRSQVLGTANTDWVRKQ